MLKNFQEHVASGIFDNKISLSFIKSSNKKERFNIYRQTVYENLRNALEITFPGIWKLIGNECANNAAFLYCHNKENLPKSGCLEDWGGSFPSFLKELSPLQTLKYLGDYAQYEWLKHLCDISSSVDEVKLQELKNYTIENVENLQFIMDPSIQLIHSQYPLWAIEKMLDNPSLPKISLNLGKSWGYVIKNHHEVVRYWLKEKEWKFIKNLTEGLTLGESFSLMNQELNGKELTKIISFLLSTNSINSSFVRKSKSNI